MEINNLPSKEFKVTAVNRLTALRRRMEEDRTLTKGKYKKEPIGAEEHSIRDRRQEKSTGGEVKQKNK